MTNLPQVFGLERKGLRIQIDRCIQLVQSSLQITVDIELTTKILHLLRQVDGHGAGRIKCRSAREGDVFEILVLKLGGHLLDGALVVQQIERFLTGNPHLIAPQTGGKGHLAAVGSFVQLFKLLGSDDRSVRCNKDRAAVLYICQRFIRDGWITHGHLRLHTSYCFSVGALDRLDRSFHFGLCSRPACPARSPPADSDYAFLLYLKEERTERPFFGFCTQPQVLQMLVGQWNQLAALLLQVERIGVALTRLDELFKRFRQS